MEKKTRIFMRHGKESGAVLILITLSTVALFGSMGLVHDFGRAYVENRQMQTAANAAALGGANTLKQQDTANVANHAQKELTRIGFKEGTVVINHPPQRGDFTGNDDFVEVVLTKELKTYFGNFFQIGVKPHHDAVIIQTRAVAGVTGSGGCIYVLTGDGERAFSIRNGSANRTPDCGDTGAVYVDNGDTLEANLIPIK